MTVYLLKRMDNVLMRFYKIYRINQLTLPREEAERINLYLTAEKPWEIMEAIERREHIAAIEELKKRGFIQRVYKGYHGITVQGIIKVERVLRKAGIPYEKFIEEDCP